MEKTRPASTAYTGARVSARPGATFAAGLLLAAAASLIAAGAALAAVGSTKHNFGSLSTGQIKSTQTSEICVFCHTPHNASPSRPLWNRQDSGATYNPYESLTLAATMTPNSPVLGQPTGSSKLCLSCHDGTIAIGSLLNMPGAGLAGTLTVTGPNVDVTGRLTSGSSAFIGTDLRDDHPISFDYGRSYPSNSEIKSNTSLPPQVKLDTSNKVQCTSCHDPHGTPNPKFLVTGLDNGMLCQTCHDKRYWNTMPAVHSTSTAVWNGLGQNPWKIDMGAPGFADDTVALQACAACHISHNGKAGQGLLKGINPATGLNEGEEWTCLNCHNGNVASKNIDPVFGYASKHDVKGVSGKHVPSRDVAGNPARESATNLGTNRHAECVDCHNPHGAKSGNHVPGGINGNIIGANLLGGWGVKPSPWGVAGSQTLSFIPVDFTSLLPGANNLEGYLCLKCHSYYAYGLIPPNVPSGNADGSIAVQSDLTVDFNPGNMSVHPVFSQGKNVPLVSANPNWNYPVNTFGLTNTFRYVDFPGMTGRTGFYTITHDSTITCSDCHGTSENLANPTGPQGPHGSRNKWILRGNETGIGSLANFCYNCHRRDVYGDEGYVGPSANMSRVPHPVDKLGLSSPFYQNGANTGNAGNRFGILCLTCHGGSHDTATNTIKGSHGSNAPAGPAGDPLGYRMMNGACVTSHTRGTTTTGVQMTFKAATDRVCNNIFSIAVGATATYNCNSIADCAF